MSKSKIFVALAASAAVLGGCNQQAASAAAEAAQAQIAKDEQAIRHTNEKWLAMVAQKDAGSVARLYTEDGALMASNAPIAVGREAIKAGWQSMMDLPGFQLTFQPEEIVISSAGDMALDRGTYSFAANPPSGAIDDKGKYVVVWRKVDGEWKVAADIFNSDLPPA